jgi:hypothetical protein
MNGKETKELCVKTIDQIDTNEIDLNTISNETNDTYQATLYAGPMFNEKEKEEYLPTVIPTILPETYKDSISTGTVDEWIIGEKTETEEEEDFFEMRSEKEIRRLLSKTLLWLANMGDYPENMNDIWTIEKTSDDSERALVQVLRWVLGEV